MVIKVIIGAFVLLFLGFFPTLYTMFHWYKKCGELSETVLEKSFNTFCITFLVWFIVIIAIMLSYGLITKFGWG